MSKTASGVVSSAGRRWATSTVSAGSTCSTTRAAASRSGPLPPDRANAGGDERGSRGARGRPRRPTHRPAPQPAHRARETIARANELRNARAQAADRAAGRSARASPEERETRRLGSAKREDDQEIAVDARRMRRRDPGRAEDHEARSGPKTAEAGQEELRAARSRSSLRNPRRPAAAAIVGGPDRADPRRTGRTRHGEAAHATTPRIHHAETRGGVRSRSRKAAAIGRIATRPLWSMPIESATAPPHRK
jgi:hypothetical protein